MHSCLCFSKSAMLHSTNLYLRSNSEGKNAQYSTVHYCKHSTIQGHSLDLSPGMASSAAQWRLLSWAFGAGYLEMKSDTSKTASRLTPVSTLSPCRRYTTPSAATYDTMQYSTVSTVLLVLSEVTASILSPRAASSAQWRLLSWAFGGGALR